MRTLAIGDIHGCLNALKTVTQLAGLTTDDRLVLLGDYVDRGPDSRGVIDWVLQKQTGMEVVALKGNHEELMLQSQTSLSQSEFWDSVGGKEALASYQTHIGEAWQTRIPAAHWSFMEATRLCFEDDRNVFVHGYVDARVTLASQDPHKLLWGRCHGMDPLPSGKRVICGHTAHKDGVIGRYNWGVCIDTAACSGGWLTCLDPATGDYWQADEQGKTQTGRLETV